MVPVVGVSYLTKRLVEDGTRRAELGLAKALLLCVALPTAAALTFWAGLERLPTTFLQTQPSLPQSGWNVSGHPRNISALTFRPTLSAIRGLRHRSQAELRSLNFFGPLWGCHEKQLVGPRRIRVRPSCRIGRNDSAPIEVLYTGDSHGSSMLGFIDVILRDAGLRGLSDTKTAIPFLVGDPAPGFGPELARPRLKARANRLKDFIQEQPQLKHGLRGVAVLLVVAFHCRVEQLSAGFVGVDVFFVLSGFLISQRVSQLADTDGSPWPRLLNFYARRIMRICPLLVLCVAVTLGVGWSILALEDLRGLLQSALSAVIGGSNVYFFRTCEEGYFATDTRKLPLLHTWSLAVELQFYLAYPLLILLSGRHGRSVCVLVFAASAAWFFASEGSGGAAYFLLPPRLWQFLAGWLAGSLSGDRSEAGGAVAEKEPAWGCGAGGWAVLGSLAGLGLAASGRLPDKASSGLACASAAVIVGLGSGQSSLPQRLLQSPPLQLCGDVSYSLYVWHWPVLSFIDFAKGVQPSGLLLAAMLPVLLVSFATKTWVEDVFRRKTLSAPGALCLVLPAALLGCLYVGLHASHPRYPALRRGNLSLGSTGPSGGDSVLNPYVRPLVGLAEPPPMAHLGPLQKACATPGQGVPAEIRDLPGCRLGLNDSGPVEVLLVGDSHAIGFAGFVDSLLRGAGKRGMLAAKRGVPFLHGDFLPPHPTLAQAERVMAFVRSQPRLRTVAIASCWHDRHDGWKAGRKALPVEERTYTLLEAALNTTVGLLRGLGLDVVLLEDFPSGQGKPKLCPFMRLPPGSCQIARKRSDWYMRGGREVLGRVGLRQGARLVSMNDVLCDADFCTMALDGLPLYYDTLESLGGGVSHINFAPSAIAGQRFLKRFPNPCA